MFGDCSDDLDNNLCQISCQINKFSIHGLEFERSVYMITICDGCPI